VNNRKGIPVKSLSKGRVVCAVLAVAVTGLGVASAAGASGTPWITRATARGPASTSAASLPTGAFYIYNNLGPGNAYNCCVGWTVGEPGSTVGLATSAMSFTPSSNAQLTQIDLALGHVNGANNATIELAHDNGGIPGTVIGAWGVAGQPAMGTCCGLSTVHTGLIPVGAGRTYWVVAIAGPNGADDTWDAWNWNTTGATGGDYYNGTWYQYGNPTGAFDVIGCGKLCKVSP
jgi:hypothetical protein